MGEQTAVEDIIEAPVEMILQAAREVLGGDPKEKKSKDGSVTLTKNVSQCPPQIKIIPTNKNKFRIVSTSLCNIKDCDYWQRCADLDSGNMQELKEAVAKLQGKIVPRGEKRWAMRGDKGRHVVEDALRK
nr:hypothetical protein [Candidatus Njordarchaeum guaymaensis]